MKSFLVVLFPMLIMKAMALPSMAVPSNLDKQGRVLPLFAVVQFQNTDCTAVSGTTATGNLGKCQSKSECTSFGGVAQGNCASGFGVCCVLTIAAAGGIVSRNSTYIASPDFSPSTNTGTAKAGNSKYTVNYVSTGICQLRLDFQTFVTVAGTDSFTTTGPTGVNPPVISGTNTGYHMYVETQQSTTATTLDMNLGAGDTTARRWNIRVDQIECTNPTKAPSGCTQYFTTLTGTITSYNYVTAPGGGPTAGNELTNQQMTACVRDGAGICTVQYKATNSAISSFVVGGTGAISSTTTCATGALLIAKVVPNTELASGFVCMGTFSALDAQNTGGTVTQLAPFNVIHRTTTAGGAGFSIDYVQQGC